MAQHLARFEPLGLTAQVEEQLATISRATVACILRTYRSRIVRLPQKGAERANQATRGVPMGRLPWDTSEPGHFDQGFKPLDTSELLEWDERRV